MTTRSTLIALFAIAIIAAACGDDRPSAPGEGSPKLTFAVSECGGFTPQSTDQRSFSYCGDEAIEWRYDKAAGTLELLDKRVLLNCCGERSTSARWEDGTLVIEELDKVDENGGRCRCNCTFDFKVTISQISDAPLALRVERRVEQPDQQQTVFSGELQLSAGSGRVVVDDTDLGGLCSEPTTEPEPTDLTQRAELSACGGFDATSDGYAPTDYCDAEVLRWSYDLSTSALSIDNRRILLNCCGERSVTIAQDDSGTLVITERDAAGDAGRCDCMCVFDLQAVAQPVTGAQIPFRLMRQISDPGQEVVGLVASGTLDLTQGSGSVVVDTSSASPWCGTR